MAWHWKNYLWGSALYYGLVWALYGGKRATLTEAALAGPIGLEAGTQEYQSKREKWAAKVLTPGNR